MSTAMDGTAPYAPMENVLLVIRRFRERSLPETLDTEELTRVGIPEGNATRTLRALRFLGLLDNDGERTELFDRLGRASTHEYPEVLAEILREAYHDIFEIIDPAKAHRQKWMTPFGTMNPKLSVSAWFGSLWACVERPK
jgi:hypothetical protein